MVSRKSPVPPLPVPFFGVDTHAKVSEKCCTATPKCQHVKPKCPKLEPKCPLFLGHFVLISFVFNNLLGSFVNFFSSAPLPYCKLDTALSFEFPVSSFKFRICAFQFRISSFESPQRAGILRVFSEAMGKSTWRGRARARSGRPGASRAYRAVPFRTEDTPPSGIASNCYAIIL